MSPLVFRLYSARIPLVFRSYSARIPLWVRVSRRATHLLSQLAARLSADWQHNYGHPIHLLETFVERSLANRERK